jgi:hypothetical protein
LLDLDVGTFARVFDHGIAGEYPLLDGQLVAFRDWFKVIQRDLLELKAAL